MDKSELEAGGVGEEDDGRPRAAAVRLLGTKIIASEDGYQHGEVLRLDAVMDTISGSRSLAREVLQALQYKGMVTLRTRVGATVQPVREWNVFDPDVIAWRLEEAPYEPMLSMTELRHAIEPRAAFLAARRASGDVRRDLVSLARKLKELAEAGEFVKLDDSGKDCREKFRGVDARFHCAILEGSGNETFRALTVPVQAALDYRITNEWAGAIRQEEWKLAGDRPPVGRQPERMQEFPSRPEPLAMWLHHGVAHAIAQHLPQAAEAFARAVIAEFHHGQLSEPFLQEALRQALRELDLRSLREADRGHFFEAIAAVADPARGAGE